MIDFAFLDTLVPIARRTWYHERAFLVMADDSYYWVYPDIADFEPCEFGPEPA